MPRITRELVAKRAEHNNGEIATLEELSLHQQDLERIEHLDKWCRHLQILYLQNNLISRIENVSRLKELRYLNLALNNLETIENLDGCEFLQKLDFTVNFIGDLLSVESLSLNIHLRELYLTGNPCTEYEGYRDFVVAILPQLETLDGKEITKSERIAARQQLQMLREKIRAQQRLHAAKRKQEKETFGEKQHNRDRNKPEFDGTGPQAHVSKESDWNTIEEPEPYTPESRIQDYKEMTRKKQEENREPKNKLEMPERVRRLEKDGKMLNVNEGKYNFHLKDENTCYILEVECPKFMDTSLIDCDVHTTFVRLSIKSKILQLVLEEEVSPDSSSVKRSQTTGHLLLTLPKVKPLLTALSKSNENGVAVQSTMSGKGVQNTTETGRGVHNTTETQSIATAFRRKPSITDNVKDGSTNKRDIKGSNPEENSNAIFEDDPNVPPLI